MSLNVLYNVTDPPLLKTLSDVNKAHFPFELKNNVWRLTVGYIIGYIQIPGISKDNYEIHNVVFTHFFLYITK